MAKYTPQSGIYVILNTKTKKVYIGQSKDIRKRWNDHRYKLRNNYHHCHYLQRAWNKYGEKTFKFQILERCSVEQLDEREQHYLDIYIPKELLYNLATDSVMPNRNPTEETRHKISESLKGNKNSLGRHPSEEARQQMSESRKGRIVSPEVRHKISEAHKGKIVSLETRQKLSERAKNMSVETRQKISESKKGKKSSEETKQKLSIARRGKPKTAEHRKKISEALKRRYAQENDK